MQSLSRRASWWLSLLFFLSGATSLAYEIIWFKRFSHIWGSSSLAIAIVVAAFLLGLGLGAHLIGRWSDDLASPLCWYGASELLIGLWAASIPWQLQGLAAVAGSIEGSAAGDGPLLFAIRLALTFAIIGPPCILMGGTLPLLIRQCTTRSLSDATGWMYGINTCGAAMGCYAVGFHLLPWLGLFWTNNLAAAMNIAIGSGAIAFTRWPTFGSQGQVANMPSRSTERSKDSSATAFSAGRARLAVPAAAALSGCAALMLQITWARELAVVVGGSTYAFTATVFLVLLGIAVGSLLFHAWLRRYGSLHQIAAVVLFVTSAATVAGQQQLPWLCDQMGLHREERITPLGNALACILASSMLELVPSIGAGVLFPLLVQLTRQSPARVGRAVGNIYALNTLGAILGATLTARTLFPNIGTAGAISTALGLYAVAILLLLPGPLTAPGRLPLAMLLATGVCAAAAIQRPDPRLTDAGEYLYGFRPRHARLNEAIDYFKEGRSCNVMVTSWRRDRALRVNGKIDAGTEIDMVTQLGLAYFARAFRPEARQVFVIGYGSGVTTGASLLFPETDVTCAEIEPAIFATSELFARINHRPQTSARLRMQFDDGRSYLTRCNRKFNIIISEPSNPWIAGVSNLFTREFFELVKRRLEPNGVLAQWIQTYNFSEAEYGLIVRTLHSVFPYIGMVLLADGGDTILLASPQPLDLESDSLPEFQTQIEAVPAIRDDLNRYFGTDDARHLLLRHFGPDESGFGALLSEADQTEINTDINMRLEFEAPKRLFDKKFAEQNELPARLVQLRNRSWLDRLATMLRVPAGSAIRNWMLGNQALSERRFTDALAALRQATATDPKLYVAYYDLIKAAIALNDPQSALAAVKQLVHLRPLDSELRMSLAAFLLAERKYQAAADQLREALKLDSDSIVGQTNLAWLLATCPDASVRNGGEAVKLAERTCQETNYQEPTALDALAAALAETGDYGRAIHLATLAIEQLRSDGQPTIAVGQRLELYYRQQPYREP